MGEVIMNIFKKNNKTLILILALLLLISTSITVYSLAQPSTVTNKVDENISQMETNYEYKATISPNVLYPEGGTIEVSDTMFKKITTAIPFDLNSTIHSGKEVLAKGTYEVLLLVKAGDLWEKTFLLEEKQSFEHKSTNIAIIDKPYLIDMSKINSFITKVEEETGVRSDQYSIEVSPNIQGTITYAGKEVPFKMEEKLIFQSSYDKIVLASEKSATSVTPFTTSETYTNSFQMLGLDLPISTVQLVSSLLSFLLLITIIALGYKNIAKLRVKRVTTQIDKINKKYGSRIITVSKKINMVNKSIFTLYSFKSVLKLSEDKELPIFFYRDSLEEIGTYFVVDGDYLYTYETVKVDVIRNPNKDVIGDAFAES